jgi:hypothetical protein
MCQEPDCKVKSVFNFIGEKKAEYCFKHKKEGMVDVISKIC